MPDHDEEDPIARADRLRFEAANQAAKERAAAEQAAAEIEFATRPEPAPAPPPAAPQTINASLMRSPDELTAEDLTNRGTTPWVIACIVHVGWICTSSYATSYTVPGGTEYRPEIVTIWSNQSWIFPPLASWCATALLLGILRHLAGIRAAITGKSGAKSGGKDSTAATTAP
jgi:hypothetical protein